jgi:hypothetical protein
MKKIFYIFSFIACINLLHSCSDFLTETPATGLPEPDAFKTAADFNDVMRGVYYNLGTYRFLGRDVLAMGEIPSDLTTHSARTSHFFNVFNYQIFETNGYLAEMWEYGYRAIDGCTRIINARDNLSADFYEPDIPAVDTQVAQAYAVRALATFYLTNFFGLPYSEANKSTLGVVNVTVPVKPFEEVARATVEQNYAHILSDIAKAKEYFGKPDVGSLSQAYMNEAALYAFEARVKLYMKDYDGAITAANKAIELRKGTIVSGADMYEVMYRSLTASSEDIFFIAKSEEDHLSANSYNTLYNNYGVGIPVAVLAEYAENDIRLSLLSSVNTSNRGGKAWGVFSNNAVSNLPVLRLPEQYLILAEAYALKATPDYAKAKANLLEVAAKRNPDLDAASLPETAGIWNFILQERKLELIQEGHRFLDLRRLGLTANVANGNFTNFEIFKFVYPIPAAEVNAKFGVVQTEGWSDNLPRK